MAGASLVVSLKRMIDGFSIVIEAAAERRRRGELRLMRVQFKLANLQGNVLAIYKNPKKKRNKTKTKRRKRKVEEMKQGRQ